MGVRPVDKIIMKAAKEVLKPIGLLQVGSSRTWVDDNGWFFIVVEFQPSSWSQGAYLNVAVSFLWEQGPGLREVLAYDVGGRVESHVEYNGNDDDFYQKMLKMADEAQACVKEYRLEFSNHPQALLDIKSISPLSVNKAWCKGMFQYLHGTEAAGDAAMREVLSYAETERTFMFENKQYMRDWVVEREELVKKVLSLPDKKGFVINSIIEKRRRLRVKPKYKKLPVGDIFQ